MRVPTFPRFLLLFCTWYVFVCRLKGGRNASSLTIGSSTSASIIGSSTSGSTSDGTSGGTSGGISGSTSSSISPAPATPAPTAPVSSNAASGDMMFPRETEWGDWFGGNLFGTPSEKKGKRKKGRLELEAPDFDIPQFGGGDIKKRYPLQIKVNAVRYCQKKVKGAQGPGGSVGISYASRVLRVPDKATLAL